MAPIDPHSYTDSSHPLTEHIHLTFLLDFQSKLIDGTALFTLPRPHEGHIFLDTRDLAVHSVSDDKGKPLDFCVGEADPIKGSLLSVKLQGNQKFLVSFRTSTDASALQWLDPEQTADAKMPYVFTQCQAIHARSIFPCQDTPAARIRYSAEVDVPKEMRVVMSAAYVGRTEGGSRAVDTFKMEQPIPPYLFALAAGDIVYKDLSPRSRVYAEPSVVESAAYEFQGTEQMMQQAEALFGPYDWERFDLLVMPPSFPYGGMENPRMVFLTPAVIVGDRSGVQVVAHELAHSWTGNLITNSSANDFWLNEGFTTYAERRIVEVLDGEERLFLHLGLGWNGLHEEIERFKDRPEFTRLKTDQENVDPDEIYSQVPYEKGCFFVRRLEKEVGRPGFDAFLKNYIKTFRFQSIDTEKFLEFLKQHLPGIEGKVDLQEWVYGVGIPSDAEKPKSLILETVLNLVEEFKLLVSGTEKEQWNTYMDSLKNSAKNWQVQEWQVYLESLPKKVHLKALEDLDKEFELSKSNNWEIRVAFLVLAANSGYEPCMVTVEHALLSFGRMRYLRPLYSGLLQGSPKSKQFALKIYEKAKSKYHPIARRVVQGLITNYTS